MKEALVTMGYTRSCRLPSSEYKEHRSALAEDTSVSGCTLDDVLGIHMVKTTGCSPVHLTEYVNMEAFDELKRTYLVRPWVVEGRLNRKLLQDCSLNQQASASAKANLDAAGYLLDLDRRLKPKSISDPPGSRTGGQGRPG